MIWMIIVFVLAFVVAAWWSYMDWCGDSVVMPLIVGLVVAGLLVAGLGFLLTI